MTKQDWKHVWQLFKDVLSYEKMAVVYCITAAVFLAAKPYFYMVAIGEVIDLFYQGADLMQLIKYILVVVIVSHIFGMIQSFAQEKFNQKLEKPKEFCTFPLNKKALTMDYEHLEDTHVQELRFRSFTKSYYGVAG